MKRRKKSYAEEDALIIRAKPPAPQFRRGRTDVSLTPTQGGAVLNATINKHAFATLVTRKDGVMNIRSSTTGSPRFSGGQKLLFNGE